MLLNEGAKAPGLCAKSTLPHIIFIFMFPTIQDYSQARGRDYNTYYQFPISCGIEHQMFNPFGRYGASSASLNWKNNKKGGKKMKTKVMFALFIPIFVGIILLGGCATTGKITEPSQDVSTSLMGRIKLTCSYFPQYWYCNGEHTNGIVIDLRNVSTKEIMKITSKGPEGLLFLPVKEGRYIITRLTFKTGGGNTKTTLYFGDDKSRSFTVFRNVVNNIGDIHWEEIYLAKTDESYGSGGGSKGGTSITGSTQNSCNFKNNYEEVKTWFAATYPESEWNNKKWHNVEVTVR